MAPATPRFESQFLLDRSVIVEAGAELRIRHRLIAIASGHRSGVRFDPGR
jgi:hypothetical protein